VTRPCAANGEGSEAFDSLAVGRRLVPHTAAVTLTADGCFGAFASDLGRPDRLSRGSFSASSGRAGLAANHNSLAPNSKTGATSCPKSDGPDTARRLSAESGRSSCRRRSYSNVQTVVRNTSWFVSKLILRHPTVRLSALTAAGLLRTAKGSSFSNTSLLIIREGKSDRRAANRVLRAVASEMHQRKNCQRPK